MDSESRREIVLHTGIEGAKIFNENISRNVEEFMRETFIEHLLPRLKALNLSEQQNKRIILLGEQSETRGLCLKIVKQLENEKSNTV